MDLGIILDQLSSTLRVFSMRTVALGGSPEPSRCRRGRFMDVNELSVSIEVGFFFIIIHEGLIED